MEQETGETFTDVLEWSIENFSCWNLGIRKVIKSPDLYEVWGRPAIHLYPRGLDGQMDNLDVLLPNIDRGFTGILNYCGPDGSVIISQKVQIDHTSEERNVRISGPKLKLILARISKQEASYTDVLTLCFKQVSRFHSRKYHVSTRISVYDTPIYIPTQVFDFKSASCVNIYEIVFPESHEMPGRLILSASREGVENTNSKIKLSLEWRSFKLYELMVRTRLFVLNENDVARTETDDHLYFTNHKRIFSNSLTTEDIAKEGFSLLLRVKVIPKEPYQHQFGFYSYFPKEVRSRGSGNGYLKIKNSHPSENSNEVLKKELMCLYQDQDFSDFQLNCCDVSFPIHKAILSARSPVFKAMLSSNMIEASSGSVDITDLDVPTLARFLTFLYTGSTDDLKAENALKLFYAADKYQVPTLQQECASVLCDNISIANVCDVLTLADRHQDERLKSVAHDFILKNFNRVLKSEEWINCMKTNGDLLLRTITYFAQKDYVGKS